MKNEVAEWIGTKLGEIDVKVEGISATVEWIEDELRKRLDQNSSGKTARRLWFDAQETIRQQEDEIADLKRALAGHTR